MKEGEDHWAGDEDTLAFWGKSAHRGGGAVTESGGVIRTVGHHHLET